MDKEEVFKESLDILQTILTIFRQLTEIEETLEKIDEDEYEELIKEVRASLEVLKDKINKVQDNFS